MKEDFFHLLKIDRFLNQLFLYNQHKVDNLSVCIPFINFILLKQIKNHALVDYKNNRTFVFFNNFTPKRHRVSTVNYDSVTRGKAPSSFCFPQPHTCMQPQLYKDSIRARITEQFLRSVIR